MKYPGSVQLLTDGAAYDEDHVLTAIVSKVWSSRKLPIAITGRGKRRLVEFLATTIVADADSAPSIDHLLEIVVPKLLEDVRRCDPDDFDIAIAAWSEADGPRLYYVDAGGEMRGEGPAWTLQPRSFAWCASMLSGSEMVDVTYKNGRPPKIGRLLSLDPDYLKDYGADMMELIRSKPTNGYFSVGGHCQLTTVTAAGVETVTLRTWPEDRVGMKISPTASSNVVTMRTPAAVMNRQCRRATARGA
jgi:hypothetical protein